MGDRGRGGGEGVRTRDHLASVRTTLTWVRTAVIVMALGYTLDKLGALSTALGRGGSVAEYGRPLGLLALAAATVMAAAALPRFLWARARIESARYEPHLAADLALIGALALGALVVFVVLGSGS